MRAKVARARCWLTLTVALACAGCPSTATQPLIRWEPPTTLGGGEVPPRHLVRGFVVRGEEQRGFGYYVYLVFLPEASARQRMLTAEAFMAQSDLGRYELLPKAAPRESLALLAAPIEGNYEPKTAKELVDDYDTAFASVVAEAAKKANWKVWPVSLIASPLPVTAEWTPRHEDLIVSDACGAADEVRLRFRQLRDGLLAGNVQYDGAAIRWISTIGRVLTRGTTEPCL